MENEDFEGLLCPLSKTITHNLISDKKNITIEEFGYCRKEKCGWFNKQIESCAVLSLPDIVDSFNKLQRNGLPVWKK